MQEALHTVLNSFERGAPPVGAAALRQLEQDAGLLSWALGAFFGSLERRVLQAAAQFWSHFPEEAEAAQVTSSFPGAVNQLHEFFTGWAELLEELAGKEAPKKTERVRALVVAAVGPLERVMECYFEGEEDASTFGRVGEQLRQMGLLQRSEVMILDILMRKVEQQVQEYAQEWEEPQLELAVEWLEKNVLSWRFELLGNDRWRQRLRFALLREFALLRISELFDIIVRYPDESAAAVKDLRECLERTGEYKRVVQDLTTSLKKRLLHPGANTEDIIQTYVSTIHTLRVLDPSGVTLDLVSAPICDYLSKRRNTIRCIVESLTDPESDLFAELSNTDMEAEGEDVDEWKPISQGVASKKGIVSLLVSIYGGSEPFVAEYQTLLGERLLQIADYNVESDTQTLELLKLKFGEGSLHDCDIMLRDMGESKRIDKTVHTEGSVVHASILSGLFWPKRSGGDPPCALPAPIQEQIDEYSRNYVVHKPNRLLEWDTTQGLVDLEVQLVDDEEPQSFSGLTVMQATILLKFGERATWSTEEIAAELQVDNVDVVRRRLAFWVGKGLIGEIEPGVFQVGAAEDHEGASMEISEDEEDDEEDDEMLETFLEHMLTNLGALPLERVHESLSSFTGGMYDKSIDELAKLLQKLVAAGKLVENGGEFGLPS